MLFKLFAYEVGLIPSLYLYAKISQFFLGGFSLNDLYLFCLFKNTEVENVFSILALQKLF